MAFRRRGKAAVIAFRCLDAFHQINLAHSGGFNAKKLRMFPYFLHVHLSHPDAIEQIRD